MPRTIPFVFALIASPALAQDAPPAEAPAPSEAPATEAPATEEAAAEEAPADAPALSATGKKMALKKSSAKFVPRTAQDRAAAEAFTIPDTDGADRRYAMRQAFTSQMRDPNPFSKSGWRSTHTYTYAIIEWREKDTKVEYQETTCSIETEKVFGAETLYSDGFIKGVPVRFRSGTLAGWKEGDALEVGPYVQQFGVDLEDPYTDPLPSSADDPRIVDDDGDGLPGVTITIRHPMVGQGKVWVGQRSVARLEGKVTGKGKIEGHIRTAPDMYKIDADRWWLRMDSPQRPHPDPKQSPFVMVETDQTLTCEKLLANKDTIFPPMPELD